MTRLDRIEADETRAALEDEAVRDAERRVHEELRRRSRERP